jgi:hypothetical protein
MILCPRPSCLFPSDDCRARAAWSRLGQAPSRRDARSDPAEQPRPSGRVTRLRLPEDEIPQRAAGCATPLLLLALRLDCTDAAGNTRRVSCRGGPHVWPDSGTYRTSSDTRTSLTRRVSQSAILFVLTAVHRRRRVRRPAAVQLQLPAQTERKLAPAPPPCPPPSEQKSPPAPPPASPPPGSPHVKFSPPPKKPPPARSIRPVYVISQSSPLPDSADGELVTSPTAKPPPSQPQTSSPPRPIDDGGTHCPLPYRPRLLRTYAPSTAPAPPNRHFRRPLPLDEGEAERSDPDHAGATHAALRRTVLLPHPGLARRGRLRAECARGAPRARRPATAAGARYAHAAPPCELAAGAPAAPGELP